MQSKLQESSTDSVWQQLAPLLDESMAELGKSDRDALVLRYFKNKNAREVGMALGLQEEAAQKRITRALEKLRKLFARRGVSTTSVLLGSSISLNSVQAPPDALVKTATYLALTKGAAASASTLGLINGGLKIMAWANAKTAVIISATLLFAAGTTTLIATSGNHATQTVFPKATWKFAGYAEPEDSIETLVWALSQQDSKTAFSSLSPECQQEFRELAVRQKPGMPAEDFFTDLTGRHMKELTEIRIPKREILLTNVVVMDIAANGGHDAWLKMRKVGDEWKVDDFDPHGSNGRTGFDHPNAQYGGVGVAIDFDKENGAPRITKVMPNSPAVQAGLTAGLLIKKINGASTEKKMLSEAVFLTRGRIGLPVVMELVDPKLKQTNTVELIRQRLPNGG